MEAVMTRVDFQRIAEIRLKDAEVLFEHGQYQGAYYLAGYVIECALKACIAKKTKEHDFPPPQSVVKKIYTHNLDNLLTASGLKINDSMLINWTLIKDWNESIRYEEPDEKKAKDVFAAIIDPEEGVFQWIKLHW